MIMFVILTLNRGVGHLIALTDLGTVAPGSSPVCRHHGNIVTLGKLLFSTCALSPLHSGVNIVIWHMRGAGYVNEKALAL